MSLLNIFAGAVVAAVGSSLLNSGSEKVAEAIVYKDKPMGKRIAKGGAGLIITAVGSAALVEGIKFALGESE